MNRIVRIVVSSLALFGALAGVVPAVAHADVENRGGGGRDAHGAVVERGRNDWDRDAWARWERERVERDRIEHARECRTAYEHGAPRWELAQMRCDVR